MKDQLLSTFENFKIDNVSLLKSAGQSQIGTTYTKCTDMPCGSDDYEAVTADAVCE